MSLSAARRRRRAGAALAGALLMGALTVAPSGASTQSLVLASGLSAASGLGVGSDGSVYVTQSFPGSLLEVSTGTAETAVKSRTPVTAVDVADSGAVTFTTSGSAGTGSLYRRGAGGRPDELADLGEHEERENPDGVSSYGFQDLHPECAADLAPSATMPGAGQPYAGDVASSPSGVATLPDGSHVVADERANALLRVMRDGSVSTLAVLPPAPVVVTAPVAAARGLPGCAIGATLNVEPAPTDVEIGPDGLLYVSSTPEGFEEGLPSATGSVYRVDPESGAVEKVAGGFRGATDLAVAPDGTIYVAELFGNQVSVAHGDKPITFRLLDGPSAVEYRAGALYVAAGFSYGPPTGRVLTIFLR